MKPNLVAMVSVYNSSRWLKWRLDNLIQTTAFSQGKLLIYCVNAESPDPQDSEILGQYEHHNNFKHETIPYCGVYAAWNHIISNTDTEFITNANSDDLCAPNAYETLTDQLHKLQANIVYPAWYTIGEDVHTWQQAAGKYDPIPAYNPDNDQISCGHFPVWRRAVHDAIGLFDPWFQALGDADLWLRAWRHGIKNIFPIQEPLCAYRWREGANLWHRVDEGRRADEWHRLYSR